jgi:hypothetical protein
VSKRCIDNIVGDFVTWAKDHKDNHDDWNLSIMYFQVGLSYSPRLLNLYVGYVVICNPCLTTPDEDNYLIV